MRKIVFRYRNGVGINDVYEEEFEFDDDVTEEEINNEFEDWVWQQVGDYVTWFEK